MNFMMRTAVEAIKGQVFKAILGRLSENEIQQRASAPVFLEKLETIAEPYVKVFPKAVNYVFAKTAFAVIFMISFFSFFTEALRQFDQFGTLLPSAYVYGYMALFAFSLLGFFFVKAPVVEKAVAAEMVTPAEAVYTPPLSASAKSTMDDASLPRDYSNVEHLRQPTPLSGAEFLLNELRAERASFFSSRA